MIQMLAGLITYLLPAIYCLEQYGEPVSIHPSVKSNPAVSAKLYEASNARGKFLTPDENQRLHS